MIRIYQKTISQPTISLTADILRGLTQAPENNLAIDCYRRFKQAMAEAQVKKAVEAFAADVMQLQEYKEWLRGALKKDERRKRKLIPEDDAKRVKLFIESHKSGLPAVIPTVTHFAESKDQWGREGTWRVQKYGYLSGLAVLDLDHVPNIEELIKQWLAREDFNNLGIVWIFITPSGEGVKLVFKADVEVGNLADNYYTLAEKLGVLEYADPQCKNSDHAHFIPRYADIKYIDWEALFTYENPDFEARYGEAYRNGESDPTQPRWQEFESQRKAARKAAETQPSEVTTQPSSVSPQVSSFAERDLAIVKALNEFYGESLPEGRRHETFISETAPWLLMLADNNAQKALTMARLLEYIKNWTDQSVGELENCIATVAKKPLLTRRPKRLQELLSKAGIDTDVKPAATSPEEDLPFDEWIEKIRALFDTYPCVREICEPHPERLWPFLLFASAGLMGTLMTLCWYRFYDQPELRRRLNYNILGVGDPASGKGALVRIASLLTEPIEQSDQLANDALNAWKEESRSKGSNLNKPAKPKGIVRLHGARTSNNVFINDMCNAWTEVDGERMQMHMLTVDTEALNSIKMQKGGSWIDKQVMEIKAFTNEKDSQQYANLDSVTGFFHVYWNLVRTCTPPALKMLVNDRNFGSGYPTRLAVLPVLGTGFKMMELRQQSQKALEADDTLRQWAYRLDKRHGELPLWPLVEHCWNWTDAHMDRARFNDDKADEMLMKRCAYYGICISAPYIDMRHWDEREQTGTYEIDDTDKALCSLVLDIQYKTQHHYFGELAHLYFEEQQKDATMFRRRTSRYELCFQNLPNEFTTEQFATTFNFANNRSANKALNRLLEDKSIVRTKRGQYRKRVQSIG